MNALLEDAIGMMQYEFHRQHIEVVRRFDPALPRVALDEDQMKQACWIVFRNAIDALASCTGERILNVSTALEQQAPEPATIAASAPIAAGWLVVRVDDTGPGVPAEVLPRVFDLFFTTKRPGKGSGIGLALARRILESHGGSIDLSNRREGGTRATLSVPLAAGAAPVLSASGETLD